VNAGKKTCIRELPPPGNRGAPDTAPGFVRNGIAPPPALPCSGGRCARAGHLSHDRSVRIASRSAGGLSSPRWGARAGRVLRTGDEPASAENERAGRGKLSAKQSINPRPSIFAINTSLSARNPRGRNQPNAARFDSRGACHCFLVIG